MSPGADARRVVVGVGGGIAAYKSCLLIRALTEAGHRVDVVPTESALNFVGAATFEALSGNPVTTGVFSDVPQVRHVALGQNADLVVIAPATADLMARLAGGRADDLLTSTVLAARCPVLLAPAMHTEMWEHPATRRNVATLRSDGVTVIPPASGRLTGVDSGAGRMPEADEIARLSQVLLGGGALPFDLDGRRLLVTAGGTREELDPVRYLGNRSSGKQGHALAAVAAARGARVTLVTAAGLPGPAGVEVVRVESADQMRRAVLDRSVVATPADATRGREPNARGGPGLDAVIKAAAVADFRPVSVSEAKIKKGSDDEPETLRLVRTPDILAELVEARRRGEVAADTVIAGFAAETGDARASVLEHARAKLRRKGSDLLVVNAVGRDLTFGADHNSGWILSASGETEVPAGTKESFAAAVLDAVAARLRR